MVYFTIDLFIDALILILNYKTKEAVALIEKMIAIYEEETKNTVDTDPVFELYINLIKEILSLGLSVEDTSDIEVFLLKFKGNPVCIKDPELYTSLKNVFTTPIVATTERYNYLARKIQNCILWHNTTRHVKKLFSELASCSVNSSLDRQDMVLNKISTLCSEIIEQNKNRDFTEEESPIRVQYLDFANKDNIKKALISYTKITKLNKFITGLQGLNRALGGGFPIGSSIVFNSVAHHGKTLMLLKMARWQVTLNTPSSDLVNPTCLIYSLENETPLNLMLLFKELYVNSYGVLPPDNIPEETIIDFCHNEFSKNGWKLVIDRRLGAEFGYYELVANFEEYIHAGFTPVMCVIDYMNMMKKDKGTSRNGEDGKNHLAVRELYTNTCNFLKSKNCTLVTAHQLNRRASEVIRTNPVGAVKKFGPDMLADSLDPQREVDIVFYQCKEKDSVGRTFLTFKEDKNRGELTLPESCKYFAYMFDGPLGIMDDVHKEDKSTTNIYAVPFDDKKDGETQEVTDANTGLFE